MGYSLFMDSALRAEIENDIIVCNEYNTAEGSQELFGTLVAKYSVVDPNFKENLSTNGKATIPGKPFDYRPELKAIASKLHMMLITSQDDSNENKLLKKIEEFIERGKTIQKEEFHPAENGFPLSFVSGPKFDTWMSEINIFNERYLKEHPLYNEIKNEFDSRDRFASCEGMIGFFNAILSDGDFFENTSKGDKIMSNKVFIVHGHDVLAKTSIARELEKAGYEAIILHEQPDAGLTIIEKIERYTDVAFAVVLYTECDLGRAKEQDESENQYRARQNVVFEHGYLISKLGRHNVCALVKGNVETPGDISGIVYIPMDEAGAWKMQLCKNMNDAGLDIDIRKML